MRAARVTAPDYRRGKAAARWVKRKPEDLWTDETRLLMEKVSLARTPCGPSEAFFVLAHGQKGDAV